MRTASYKFRSSPLAVVALINHGYYLDYSTFFRNATNPLHVAEIRGSNKPGGVSVILYDDEKQKDVV